ncbi:MAG: UvrABC system protein, partial [Pedosphaera sp.]|nr:UvrABC system protein [Pedosphaera sp.]
MGKTSSLPVIRLRGVRHNNLKNFDLDLPLNQLIVITGLSGSGKSSLAFDTLFAEGQRRYIETFSPYSRQFFDRMDKPQVDSIEGIPPAIAIEQRNSVKSTRSTVGTMTEICDYMKLLWPQVSQLHCRQCGRPVRKDSPQQIWEGITSDIESHPLTPALSPGGGEGEEVREDARPTGGPALIRTPQSAIRNSSELLITFCIPISEKLSLDESLALINKQGYQRLLLNNEILRLDEAIPQLHKLKPDALNIIQDRLKPAPENRPRFIEACEQAYHFGKGKLTIYKLDSSSPNPQSAIRNPQFFSNRLHCATCDIEYREPSPALFSFNHPVGACPACRGFGRVISIDYNLAMPDRSKTLAQGVVRPWQTGQSAESQADLMKFCRIRKAPVDVPFQDLPKKWQDWVINGDPDYGKDAQHEWPRAWYGIKGYFRWLESKSYKMHVRVLLSRYRSYTPCPDCHGKRFQPETLLYKVSQNALTLSDFYQLPVREAFRFIEQLGTKHQPKPSDPLGLIINEVRSRLGFLNEVGLGYLTLDRPTRSLSGGETERVNLTTCLGTRLVNTLFVLDEPSVGLHPRDTSRLVRILEQLRNAGNTVVVVEHEASVMRAADQIVDIGPGHGAAGGEVVFQGP